MAIDWTKTYKGRGKQTVPFGNLTAEIDKPTINGQLSNYWTIKFSEPINGEQFNTFMTEQLFFGYHPAGYGGGTNNNPTRLARVSTDWSYSCYDSCD